MCVWLWLLCVCVVMAVLLLSGWHRRDVAVALAPGAFGHLAEPSDLWCILRTTVC